MPVHAVQYLPDDITTLGDLTGAVEDLGLADNTIFIFYSDNGGVDNRFDNTPSLCGRPNAL